MTLSNVESPVGSDFDWDALAPVVGEPLDERTQSAASQALAPGVSSQAEEVSVPQPVEAVVEPPVPPWGELPDYYYAQLDADALKLARRLVQPLDWSAPAQVLRDLFPEAAGIAPNQFAMISQSLVASASADDLAALAALSREYRKLVVVDRRQAAAELFAAVATSSNPAVQRFGRALPHTSVSPLV